MPSSVARNTTFLTVATIFQKIGSFTFFLLLARALEVSGTGSYLLVLSMIGILSAFVDPGLQPLMIREIARSPSHAFSFLRRVLFLKIPFFLFTGIALFCALWFFGGDRDQLWSIFLPAAGLLFCDGLTVAFYGVLRGYQDLRAESFGLILGQIVILSMGALALTFGEGNMVWFLYALLSGSFLNMVYGLTVVSTRLTREASREPLPSDFHIARQALPFFLSNISSKISSYADSVLLSFFLGAAAVGTYGLAYKVTYAFQFLPLAFVAALYPGLSATFAKDPKKIPQVFHESLRYMATLAAPIVFGMWSIAPQVVALAGGTFAESTTVLRVLIFALLPLFLDFPVGALLNATGHQKQKMFFMMMATLMNVVLNILLIPFLGPVGSAVAGVASFTVLFLLGAFFLQRIFIYPFSSWMSACTPAFFSGLLMALFVLGASTRLPLPLLLPTAAAVYAICLVLLRGVTVHDLATLRRLLPGSKEASLPKRLLLATLDFFPQRGGVARYTQELARFLGNQTLVLAPPSSDAAWDLEQPYTIIRRPLLARLMWPAWTRALLSFFRERKQYDRVIVQQVLPLGLVALCMKRLFGVPYSVCLHGLDLMHAKRSHRKLALLRYVLARADHIFVNSSATQERLASLGVSRSSHIVYPPLSSFLSEAAQQSSSLKKTEGSLVHLLTVSRLVPRKGHQEVLQALHDLRKKHPERAFTYTIVGEGPLRTSLEDQVQALGLEDVVTFVGTLSDGDLIEQYRQADLFVMPTTGDDKDPEGFGMVYVEAAAFGVPAIASDVPGVREAVIHASTGLLVPPGDEVALQQALSELISDVPLRHALGREARRRALQDFTPEQCFAPVSAWIPDASRKEISPKRLSLIIPAYQHGATLSRCLQGVFAQTRLPDEVIVINDGSTDETPQILERFADHVQVIHQENQGSNQARMRGFEASKGDLVLFLDADVLMHPTMLKRLEHALLEHPEASYAYGGFRFGWKRFRSFPFDPTRLRAMNYIHTSALIRREHFPGFDPRIRRFQDWDIWLTMLSRGYHGVFVRGELFRVLCPRGRKGISQWRPSFLYQVSWKRLGWMPHAVSNFLLAREEIFKKHGL